MNLSFRLRIAAAALVGVLVAIAIWLLIAWLLAYS
jgi:hypothetical protein